VVIFAIVVTRCVLVCARRGREGRGGGMVTGSSSPPHRPVSPSLAINLTPYKKSIFWCSGSRLAGYVLVGIENKLILKLQRKQFGFSEM
jgi:hypothetical protein